MISKGGYTRFEVEHVLFNCYGKIVIHSLDSNFDYLNPFTGFIFVKQNCIIVSCLIIERWMIHVPQIIFYKYKKKVDPMAETNLVYPPFDIIPMIYFSEYNMFMGIKFLGSWVNGAADKSVHTALHNCGCQSRDGTEHFSCKKKKFKIGNNQRI